MLFRSQPLFSSDPINIGPATNGVAYAGTLAGDASDPGGKPLTFSKVSGPAWLSVATNGVLSGTPLSTNLGLNSWLVRITNGVGGSDDAILLINVSATNSVAPSGPPVITSTLVSGSNLIISGTNSSGTAGGTYYLRASTNVVLPIISWPRISTNTYGAGGAFSVTNQVNLGTPNNFYRLEQ